MKYILGIGAVFALAWLPCSGCCQPPAPQAPPHQFGGYHGAPVQPHNPQSSGAGVQQYPGSTGMPSSQAPAQQQFQPPVQQQPQDEFEHAVPDSGPMQGP